MASLADMLSGKSAENLKNLADKAKEEKRKNDLPSSPDKPVNRSHKQTGSSNSPINGNDVYHVHMPNFVAVDLETTGLDKRTDRITEIGMVRYENGREVASYSKLINPQRDIPPFITKLTGISDDMVKDAPIFRDLADEILDFIGRDALCGHQVDFEYTFLNMELDRIKRPPLKNLQIDTLSTARMILTQEEGYALGKVAAALGIELENAHRALDDARASGEICLRLLPKIGELPPQTRKKLAGFAPFSLTRRILESSVKQFNGEIFQYQKSPLFPTRQPINSSFLLQPDHITEQFRSGGVLSGVIPNWNYREEQEQYAQMVAESLNSSSAAALEAGTGTGKSLGYLIPAALWAVQRGERVIVSTNTKNLQDQLTGKDLPLVKKAVGEHLTFCALKGRGNYLCKEGFEKFLAGETGSVSSRERGAMMPLIKWADETTTGDIEELNSFNRNYHDQIWSLISAENKRCDAACPHFENCFMINARKRAANAHIVVVNHALFYSDITAGSPFVGETGAIIIDEAHNLESSGHRMLRAELDTKRIEKFTDFIQQLLTTISTFGKSADDYRFTEAVAEMKKVVKRLRKNHEGFLTELMQWGEKREPNADETHNGIAVISYGEREFMPFCSLAGYRLAINDTIDICNEIRRLGAVILEKSIALAELKIASDEASQLRADLIYLTESNTDGDIFWMELPQNRKWIKLIGTTVDVSDFLKSFWKEQSRPLIVTSATMSYKDDLSYFIHRIGLDELNPSTAQFRGSFHHSQTLFLSRPDAPDPSTPEFVSFVADQIMTIHETYEKNMMVLFTSNGQLAQMHETLEKRFTGKKIPLFAQGISGNRAWITQQMSEVRGAILLGSGSFWEGVDIPGEGCEIVIIPKLPFPVPSHPLAKALADRAELKSGRNGFVDYHLPEALLKFRQGTGRLIRHDNDRGALIILDSRMDSKPYGKKFVRLVESEHSPVNSTESMIDQLNTFFKG